MRTYRITVEIEKRPAEKTASQALEALRRMPAVFDPDVDPDFPNIHGRPVARFAFTSTTSWTKSTPI